MRQAESDCLESCFLVEAGSSTREGGGEETLLPIEDAHRPPKRGERSMDDVGCSTKPLRVAFLLSMVIALSRTREKLGPCPRD